MSADFNAVLLVLGMWSSNDAIMYAGASGGQSCIRHVGDFIWSHPKDQCGVNKLFGMWEAVGDEHAMAEALLPQLEVDKLVEGVGLI